jgi:ATP-dependent Lon protease
MDYIEEKEKLKNALDNLKITKSQKSAGKILADHIGFEKEKERFQREIRFYIIFRGNFRPLSKVVCYAGPPGIGKTTFVQTLSEAMGRDLKLIACAGLESSPDFSILGSSNKPSLLA